MWYHLIPIRMTITKKTKHNKCWWGCGEYGTLVPCWQEWKMVWPLWKTVWWFLKILKIELPHDPKIPVLCKYPEKLKAGFLKRYLYTHVHSIIHSHQEVTQLPIYRWVNKLEYKTHTMEHYSALKKKGNPSTCYNTDEPQRHYAKWQKPVIKKKNNCWMICLYEISRVVKFT